MMHPKKLLEKYQLEPKQSLGQNFLYDDGILTQIAAWAELDKSDRVLEIGAGIGSLTHHLAKRAGEVVAIEIDGRFFPILAEELRDDTNVRLIQGDILDLDLAACIDRPYKVVANVPYYITGAILRHVLSPDHLPTLIVMTVQREVAERIAASPPHMSLLALGVQYFGRPSLVSRIKAGAFWPRPEVDSAVIRVEVNLQDSGPRLASQDQFFQVARAAFSQKRKQLKNNLRQLGRSDHDLSQALLKAGINGRRRAETVTVDEWRRLAAVLHEQSDGEGVNS